VGKKLLEIMADKIRFKHYIISTEKLMYIGQKDIYYSIIKNIQDMGKNEIELFLTHLATQENVPYPTQNQVFSTLLFLYEQVLHISLKNEKIQALRAQMRKTYSSSSYYR
jgi:hypothetical protein